jgi:Flp pilus assembly pilin Flp
MNTLFLASYRRVVALLRSEQAQDLPEYAIALVMIGLGSVAGLNSLALGISIAFNNVSNQIASAL